MSPGVLGIQPGRSSGIVDTTSDGVIQNIVERLEALEKKQFVSAQSGAIVTSEQAAVALTGGPSLTVPAGTFLFTLCIFCQAQAEGLTGLESYISGVHATFRPCYVVTRNTFDGGIVTGQVEATIVEDTFKVFVASSAKVSASFSIAVISAQRV